MRILLIPYSVLWIRSAPKESTFTFILDVYKRQEPDCTEDLPERITLHVWPGQGRFRLCEGEELCLEAAIYQNESGVYLSLIHI